MNTDTVLASKQTMRFHIIPTVGKLGATTKIGLPGRSIRKSLVSSTAHVLGQVWTTQGMNNGMPLVVDSVLPPKGQLHSGQLSGQVLLQPPRFFFCHCRLRFLRKSVYVVATMDPTRGYRVQSRQWIVPFAWRTLHNDSLWDTERESGTQSCSWM